MALTCFSCFQSIATYGNKHCNNIEIRNDRHLSASKIIIGRLRLSGCHKNYERHFGCPSFYKRLKLASMRDSCVFCNAKSLFS